ncbi:hypothetical protein Tco_0345760 [Tanacetum coccineum]
MHESGDLHAFRGSLHASSFNLESFHEILDCLSIPLLDIVDFHWIFNVLLLLHKIRGMNGSTSSHVQGTAKSSSSEEHVLPYDSSMPRERSLLQGRSLLGEESRLRPNTFPSLLLKRSRILGHSDELRYLAGKVPALEF